MRTSTGRVLAADGTQISYRTAGSSGNDNVPVVVLIHGWAQSSRSWGDALIGDLSRDFRVIAIDLRGHGDSSVPTEDHLAAEDFGGDIAAVLKAEVTGGQQVYLAGWSYGGLVIGDYLKYRADSDSAAPNPAGLILVGAITSMGRGEAGGRVGPAMRAALPAGYSDDPAEATAALLSFVDALVPADQGALAQRFLGTSLSVPPAIRAGLFGRGASYDELIAGFDGQVLIVHGTADPVVDISCAQHVETLVPGAITRYWDGAGHAPFVEDPIRFAAQVREFVTATAGALR